jgi:hypothetical protein
MTRAPFDGWRIMQIPIPKAQAIVVRHHYLHRRAPCSVAFGLIDPEWNIKGVVMYGTPSSAPLRSGICGPEYANDVCELTRLWVADDVPRNGESYLIGNTVRKATKPIIVSYAEIEQGHIGVVYQATNWIYTGLSAERTNWTIDGDDRHCQTLADQMTAKEIREKYGDRFSIVPRPRKHRYVFIAAGHKKRKAIMAALRYQIEPYPKAEKNEVSQTMLTGSQTA